MVISRDFLQYSRSSSNGYLSTTPTFFCLRGGCGREVQLYILNKELLLGAKKKETKNQTKVHQLFFIPYARNHC